MNAPSVAGLGALVALVVAACLSGVLAGCGPVDRPRDRGMHTAPTPTAGGLALIGGLAMAILVCLPWLRASGGVAPALTAGVAVALAHGLLGAVDDVLDLGARAKLVLQLGLALAFALLVHPAAIPIARGAGVDLAWPIAVGGVALWMIVAVNAVNFMDGSNGLVAGALAIILGGVGAAALGDGGLAPVMLAAAGACLGFLPWNYPRARLFQGDAGALFLGALIAAAAVAAASPGRPGGPLSLFTVPLALTPLLTDVLLTLIVRARRKAPLFEAHRDHLYQRWLAAHGGDHGALARRVWTIVGFYTLAAMTVAKGDPAIAVAAFGLGVAVSVIGWLWLDRGLRRSG